MKAFSDATHRLSACSQVGCPALRGCGITAVSEARITKMMVAEILSNRAVKLRSDGSRGVVNTVMPVPWRRV
jgi:hypothetical protein